MPDTLLARPLTGLRTGAARLAALMSTPLVPSDYLDLLDPLNGRGSLRAQVVAVVPETRDAVTIVLRPGRGWRGHLPGQYVRIGIDVDGVRQWRAYSVTSAPRTDDCMAITVKAIPDGVVSNHLVRRAQPGLVVQLDQPAGDFVLRDPFPRKALFVTAGSGITPVMGILRHHLDRLDDVVLLHSAPGADDVIFGAELRRLDQRANFRLVEWHSDNSGFLGAGDLQTLVPDLASRETWACGPIGLLEMLDGYFAGRGITERLHTERFRPTIVVTGDGGRVAFRRSDVQVDADAATPLLDAGETAGVLMPSGCRMGICYGCVVPLREGAVRDLRSGDLTTATEGDGVLIQTCVSAAAGDCSIDL